MKMLFLGLAAISTLSAKSNTADQSRPMKTPSSRVCPSTFVRTYPKNESGPYVAAEFLYWQSALENFNIAFEGPSGSTAPIQTATLFEPEYSWDPGVRAYLGYDLPYDGWDVDLNGTLLRSDASTKITAASGNVLSVAQLVQNTVASGCVNRWKLNFYALDLELGRRCHISPHLVLKPYGGIKAAWLHQRMSLSLVDPRSYSISNVFPTTGNFKNNFGGIGGKIGASMRYELPKDVGIFFRGATAILYGKYNLTTRYDNFLGDPDSPRRTTIAKETLYRFAPMTELALGSDWTYCFPNNYSMKLWAGYEFQTWWSQNKFFTTNTEALGLGSSGNLYLQGLTAGVELAF